MWRTPLSLFGGGAEVSLYFTSDTYIGDLYTYMGSPAGVLNVVVTADNCDVAGIYISSAFTAGSTFQCTAVNSGRFIGTGGAGGRGGDDFGETGQTGFTGFDGGHAIASEGWTVNVDVDDGFLLGGGGGGGGGAAEESGGAAQAGGGGGGGQGWHLTTETPNAGETASVGGLGGSGSVPAAQAGSDGSISTAGAGGNGGDTGIADGGAGGGWGEAGANGFHEGLYKIGGPSGNAGNAFAPISGTAAINFNGSTSEADLRTGGKVLGETDGFIKLLGSLTNFVSGVASVDVGWEFGSGGLLRKKIGAGYSTVTGFHWRDTSVGVTTANFVNTNYEVRSVTGTRNGTWDAEGAADGTWVALTAAREWYITTATIRQTHQLFEIRRTTAAGGTGNAASTGYLRAEHEDYS